MTRTQGIPRTRFGAVALALATFATLAPAGLSGQTEPGPREGQWLAVGLGGGIDQIACAICAGTPKSGVAGFVRFGGTMSDRVLLGGEMDLWTRSEDDIRQYLGGLSAIGLLYAGPEARFHVKGGLGVMGFRATEDGDALTSLAFGINAGIGYDFAVKDDLSITPFASLSLAPFADLKFNGELAQGGATLGLLKGGLSLTWH
ncbi:MAG: hypothetical protein R3195_17905 [Gemmatimonadota bacterium]|nr:hypothetical protein [Gemmatimonadota bacterium]